jgi:beta-mannosidase
LEPDPIDIEVTGANDGYAVSVTAHSLARDVTVLVDQAAADATVDDALITLAAGQSWTFRVQTAARDLEQALARPPVLRTANDLQHTHNAR